MPRKSFLLHRYARLISVCPVHAVGTHHLIDSESRVLFNKMWHRNEMPNYYQWISSYYLKKSVNPSIHLHSRVVDRGVSIYMCMQLMPASNEFDRSRQAVSVRVRVSSRHHSVDAIPDSSDVMWFFGPGGGGNLNICLTSCNRFESSSYLNNSLGLSSHRLRSINFTSLCNSLSVCLLSFGG